MVFFEDSMRAGEVQLIVGVGGVGLRAALVGGRGGDVAHQTADVIVVLRQLRGELVEELGIRGRVRDANIVDRIDHADA